jgi:hypothetical protein
MLIARKRIAVAVSISRAICESEVLLMKELEGLANMMELPSISGQHLG